MKRLILMTALLAGGSMAQAADYGEAPQVKVSLADLNLTQPEGVRVAYARIKVAASQVCPMSAGPVKADVAGKVQACRDNAIAEAVRAVKSTLLLAYHDGNRRTRG